MKIIKLAIRSILSFRKYSGINLLGLALSLACVITIFRYVYGEFTVDRFYKNIDRIFLTVKQESWDGRVYGGRLMGEHSWWRNRTKAFIDLMEQPGVAIHSLFSIYFSEKIEIDNRKYNAMLLAADSNFLKITDYPIIAGADQLTEPKTALITERFAKKLFGAQNPVGMTFQYSDGAILTITGVIGNTSTKATISFDMIISYYFAEEWLGFPQTFVLLHPGVDYRTINKRFETFDSETNVRYQLFPLSKLYFNNDLTIIGDTSKKGNVPVKGNYSYVLILMTVGLVILFTGSINYVNIYTVIVLHRGRELGVKKVFGAGRRNIFVQLFVENMIMTGLALILAFIITNVASPFITDILQLDQVHSIRFDLLLSFGILLVLPAITVLYPFFRYCYFTPVNSFSSFDKIRGADSLRGIFLSIQYTITIAMIIVSLFFVRQLQFMVNSEPGYQTKDIIKVSFIQNDHMTHFSSHSLGSVRNARFDKDYADKIEIKNRINDCPLFTYWTFGEFPNKERFGQCTIRLSEGDYMEAQHLVSDENWLKLFGIQLIAGRLWNDQLDDRENNLLIVTESFLKQNGIADFSDVRVVFKEKEENVYRITGVVKDFFHLHLSQKKVPVILSYWPLQKSISSFIASVAPGRMPDAIEFLRKLQEDTTGGEFEYTLLEDEIREMYHEDATIASIYSFFTLIAIFVSALGLFSMSLFDIQQRRKEIAIRKINGATIADINRLLLKKYFLSLTISFVIASPVALFAINRYLEGFANKAPVSWWLYAVALIVTTGVSLLTLMYQTREAANQNPVEVIC